MNDYVVYIVSCSDGTYYTGIARDVERRMREHNGIGGSAAASRRGKGARYTSTRRPVRLVYRKALPTRSAALKEEFRIKRLPRPAKAALVAAANAQ